MTKVRRPPIQGKPGKCTRCGKVVMPTEECNKVLGSYGGEIFVGDCPCPRGFYDSDTGKLLEIWSEERREYVPIGDA